MRVSSGLCTKLRGSQLLAKNNNSQSKMTAPVVYHSLGTVLDVLKSKLPEEKVEVVQELLSIYDETTKSISAGAGKHPVIVIEGLDAVGKTTITNRLVKLMDAELLTTPPQCVKHMRHVFDDDSHLRTAFYSLGNYIAQAQIMQARKSKPVIVDRYWHSTAAYALAEAVKSGTLRFPSPGHRIYEWPFDLLKPDVVLYLCVSEGERRRRHAARNTTNTIQEQELQSNDVFRDSLTEAYKNMTNPGIQEVIADGTVEDILDHITEKIKYLFQ